MPTTRRGFMKSLGAAAVASAAIPAMGAFAAKAKGSKNDRATLRWVRTGRSQDSVTELLSGLEAGETYVVDQPAGLNDGSPVVVR